MITTWFTGLFPSKPAVPGFRYKQTSVAVVNSGSATYDGGGYVITTTCTNNFRGDSVTPKWTYDPLKGDLFAFGATVNRSTTTTTSAHLQYQSGASIAALIINSSGNSGVFCGVGFTIPGTITGNHFDFAVVADMTAKTVKLLVSAVVGGPKTELASHSFQTVVASNLVQIFHSGETSTLTGIKVYNNDGFAL